MSALRRPAARPTSAASSASDQYFGPGLSIQEHADKPPPSRASALEEQNAALHEQVQHLQHLLSLTSAPATDDGPSTSNSRHTSTSSGTTHPKPQPLQPLQRHKAQIAQLQRQVNTLQSELASRNSVCLEADAIIHEFSRRLEPLLAAMHSSNSSGTNSSSGTPGTAIGTGASSRGVSTGSRAGADAGSSSVVGRGTGAGANAAGGARGRAGSGMSQQVLQECGELAAWCKQMQHRLGRARAQASVALRRLPTEEGGSWSGSKGPQHATDDAHTSLPYVAAGGNRFLQQNQDTAPVTIPALCAGRGILLADVSQVHALEVQLGALAPSLAGLAVALRSVLLPAMPWLSIGLKERLQGDVAETAEAAAAAAAGLAELSCLLPASCSLAGAAPVAIAKRSAAKSVARSQAEEWGGGVVEWDGAFGVAGSQSQEHVSQYAKGAAGDAADALNSGLSEEEQLLFQRLEEALAGQAGSSSSVREDTRGLQRRSGSSSFGGSRAQYEPFTTAATARSSSSPGSIHSKAVGTAATATAAAAAVRRGQEALRKLWLGFVVQQWQRRVLEVQLGFVAEASSAQARLVSELVVEVVDAVKTSTATAAGEHEAAHRRQVLAAVQSLAKAARLLEQRPGEAASRGAADCLMRHADALDLLPEVVEQSSASTIQAAAIAAAQRAYADFSAHLHAGQARCSKSSKHAKQRAAELQRQQESLEF